MELTKKYRNIKFQFELNPEGNILNQIINSEESVSKMMKAHFERAILSYELPKLPKDLKHSNLKIGFIHEFPPLPHLLYIPLEQKNVLVESSKESEKEMTVFEKRFVKINERLQRKIKLKQALKLYHYQLKKRIEKQIHVF